MPVHPLTLWPKPEHVYRDQGPGLHPVSHNSHGRCKMLLLIDNYDSFTYNLVHYLGELGADVQVWRNDALTVQDAMGMNPAGILLSPGPCDPDQAGICLALTEAAAETRTPLMGVCLGHQTIGQAFGGKVVRCDEIVHGKMGTMHHTGKGLFEDLPTPFEATRYHSLVVDRDTLPDCLEITAELDNGVIMGFQHRDLPIQGVQFHPESIASEHGHKMLQNFLDLMPQKEGAAA
ncbi:anthranilate synthase, component II [Shimia haliotis]|uniref:Anthranilate synthase, component II n=2 Tax=Shimia haliotis TaxID=1280847 RepID=A0A1I4APB8_9RHOB|nr:anthranilate synthase, component II [Shimia haliotis]